MTEKFVYIAITVLAGYIQSGKRLQSAFSVFTDCWILLGLQICVAKSGNDFLQWVEDF